MRPHCTAVFNSMCICTLSAQVKQSLERLDPALIGHQLAQEAADQAWAEAEAAQVWAAARARV